MVQPKSKHQTVALAAATAATVDLTPVKRRLEISHNGTQPLYLKFWWAAGETEPSASNFDARIPANERWVWARNDGYDPRFKNVRLVSSAIASVGVWGY